METFPVPTRPLLVVGGSLALDLANTVDEPGLPGEFDHLGGSAPALAWAGQLGLVTEDEHALLSAYAEREPDRAAAEVRRLRRLRAAVQEVFGAVAGRAEIPAAAWGQLRRAASAAVGAADLEPRGDRAGPTWSIRDLDALAHPVAYAALELLTAGPLDRVRRCAGCPWLYVDRSRNGRRRWCSMADCGTSAKMRRYVAKRAARRTG